MNTSDTSNTIDTSLVNKSERIKETLEPLTFKKRIRYAVKAALIHFIGSLMVAALSAALVFGVWFPYPYYEMLGGRELFFLVVTVDVVCGPLLTLVLYNPRKPRAELIRDLGLVVLIQLAALGYGLYSVAKARPVAQVFEVDRMRMVTAAEIDKQFLAKAQAPYNQLSWLGFNLYSIRKPQNSDELTKSLDYSMQGVEPSMMPNWWQAYDLAKDEIRKKAQPVDKLYAAYPKKKALIDQAVGQAGRPKEALLWLPLTSSRSSEWVVFLSKETLQPLAYAPVDGFFD